MEVRFSYNKADIISALRVHFKNRKETKLIRLILLALLIIVVVGNFFKIVPLAAVIGVVIIYMLVLFSFTYLLPTSIYNRSQTFKENIHLQYDDDGISIGTQMGNKNIRWNRFNSVLETIDFFYLYRDNKSFFLIPSQAFTDEDAKLSFKKLVQKNIKNYAVEK